MINLQQHWWARRVRGDYEVYPDPSGSSFRCNTNFERVQGQGLKRFCLKYTPLHHQSTSTVRLMKIVLIRYGWAGAWCCTLYYSLLISRSAHLESRYENKFIKSSLMSQIGFTRRTSPPHDTILQLALAYESLPRPRADRWPTHGYKPISQ